MRVPPPQSGTARAARASARAGSRRAQVRRQAREPGAERERLDVPAGACGATAPAGTSPSRGRTAPSSRTRRTGTTSLRGTSLGRRQPRSSGHPRRCASPAAASAAGRARPWPTPARSRRERRIGRSAGSRSISRRSRAQLVAVMSGEVAPAQQLVGERRRAAVVVSCRRPPRRRRHSRPAAPPARRLRHLAAPGSRPIVGLPAVARRPLPVGGEGGVEDVDVVAPRDQRAAQRVVDVVAAGEVDERQPAQGVLQPARGRPRGRPRAGCGRR